MIVRSLSQVDGIEWGNGLSRRFLTQKDGMGYTLTDTMVRAGSRSPLEYRNHLEACYCISGAGLIVDSDGTEHPIKPGTMYALDRNDPHYLIACPTEDLRLVCVFSPALAGHEAHNFEQLEFSNY